MLEGTTQAYDLYQLADALGLSHWTLRKHVKQGSIHVTRMGNRIRVTHDEVNRLLREGLPSLATPKALAPQAEADAA